jgi:hypothetical protein
MGWNLSKGSYNNDYRNNNHLISLFTNMKIMLHRLHNIPRITFFEILCFILGILCFVLWIIVYHELIHQKEDIFKIQNDITFIKKRL